jgi:hypothetical protein
MFKRAGSSLAPHFRRLHTRADAVNKNIRRNPRVVALASTAIVGSALWYMTNQKVYNDAQSSSAVSSSSKGSTLTGNELNNDHSDTLHSLVWGSNRYVQGARWYSFSHMCFGRSKTLLPNGQSDEPIRVPAVAGWLEGVALRDLALHERHGACVDARGDVYQWGDGFFGQEDPGNRMPHRTLRGKVHTRIMLAVYLFSPHFFFRTSSTFSLLKQSYLRFLRREKFTCLRRTRSRKNFGLVCRPLQVIHGGVRAGYGARMKP